MAIAEEGGTYNHTTDDVLVGKVVTIAKGRAVLLGALELAQQESQ